MFSGPEQRRAGLLDIDSPAVVWTAPSPSESWGARKGNGNKRGASQSTASRAKVEFVFNHLEAGGLGNQFCDIWFGYCKERDASVRGALGVFHSKTKSAWSDCWRMTAQYGSGAGQPRYAAHGPGVVGLWT